MRRERRVKIVATLGPASSSRDVISQLFDAGTDTFRINMSHTPHDGLRTLHGHIRKVEAEKGRPIGILVDLQGPKLRIGKLADEPLTLEIGDTAVFINAKGAGKNAGKGEIPLPHPEIFAAAGKGDRLLLDDGKIKLEVTKPGKKRLEAKVAFGGELSSRKGISLPDTVLPFSAVTEKDRADLDYAVNLGIDWIGLSFIQRPEDVAEAKKAVRGRAAIMAKIEKPSAVNCLNDILDLTDGIMVARGDLGVEMPIEQVPGAQKRMIRAARAKGKPVVVATQMLESMIHAPVPTRAEVSDVATAVFEGADAVMLSAESAVGEFPAEAVRMMDRIGREVEHDPLHTAIIHAQEVDPEQTSADAISSAARIVAETLDLACIVCWTSSGATGLRAARERPDPPIIVLTPIAATGRRLAVVWGLHCVVTADAENLDDVVGRASRIAFQEGFAAPGKRIIITAGVPLGTPGATNMLRIAFVGDEKAGSD